MMYFTIYRVKYISIERLLVFTAFPIMLFHPIHVNTREAVATRLLIIGNYNPWGDEKRGNSST